MSLTFPTFKGLKAAGLPKLSAKLSKLGKIPTFKSSSVKAPKITKNKSTPAFNLAKYSKLAKIPKSKKVTLLKGAIKKSSIFS